MRQQISLNEPAKTQTLAEHTSRRNFFSSVGHGLHGAALASMLSQDLFHRRLLANETSPQIRDLKPRPPQFEPQANAVIHLFMNGGPSQMDLFDPKPELDRLHGKSLLDKIAGEIEAPMGAGSVMRSPFKFAQHGQCGMWVSELLPEIAKHVDEITLIRSMHTSNLTHEPALFRIHSGREMPGLPSLGAWITYGLGSENQNLPAYVVLDDPQQLPVNGVQNWQAGFLPPQFQGTRFRSQGAPVLNLKPDFEQPKSIETLERDLIGRLDRIHQRQRASIRDLDARIASYELAARMQVAASDALDLSQETQATLAMYGIGEGPTDSYGRRCLIARRLIERGVRFVQLFISRQIWDNHSNIGVDLKNCCQSTDKPTAGLLADLKQRGLISKTLVMWGGEFGRLPIAQLGGDKDERKAGRDHNRNAMVTWMAGGGVKSGLTYGSTDEIGMSAVENKVDVSDWHATILHLLGLHHKELFLKRNGFEEKLTGVLEAKVVTDILK